MKTLVRLGLVPVFVLAGFALFIATLGSQAGAAANVCDQVMAHHGALPGLTAEQLDNAATIIRVGQARQPALDARAWTIAIATALQESGLRNLSHGDRDSLGLFQQRPSTGWGTPQEVQDPVYAAGKFYDHLVQVPGWEAKPLTVAAQTVQRSAFPDAYAQHEGRARAIVAAVAGVVCNAPGQSLADASTAGGKALNAAAAHLGIPYAWGGGTHDGPSRGFCDGFNGYLGGRCVGASTVGFDCSGLTMYAWAKATGGKIRLAHQSGAQWNATRRVTRDQLQPGDLLFFSTSGSAAGIHHVALYAGNGAMLHAPRTGKPVQITPAVFTDSYWGRQFIGAGRPG